MQANRSGSRVVSSIVVFIIFCGGPVGIYFAMNRFRGVGYNGFKFLETRLKKPSFTLPLITWEPVWYAVYILYGVASFVLWYVNGFAHSTGPYIISSIKFLFSIMWHPLFFYWENIEVTFIATLLTWVFNGITMVFFAGTYQIAGLILIPEQIWLSYLSIWTFYLWNDFRQTNPGTIFDNI